MSFHKSVSSEMTTTSKVQTIIPTDLLYRKLWVLDGGFGSLLKDLGYSVNTHVLWSGGANIDNPELVLTAHKQFINAGANILITNTYHCSIQKMVEDLDYTREQSENVIKEAVKLSVQAIVECGTENSTILVGSIGPYATYRRDGSEYSGSYTKSDDFKSQSKPLIESGVETLVFETIPSLVEVECVGKVLEQLNITAWIVVSCKDDSRTRSGDEFSDVVRLASTFPKVQCIGINCTSPLYISALLKTAFSKTPADTEHKPLVVYPNSGENYNTAERFEGEPYCNLIAECVTQWSALGARVIGGCCRVLPPHIRQVASAVAASSTT